MISAFRAVLGRHFTTPRVEYTHTQQLLQLDNTGEQHIYFYRQDIEASQQLFMKLKAEVDGQVEDLGLVNELDRLQLTEIMSKHNVKVPKVVLNEIMSWRR
jgi:hypothetical protein